MSALQERHQLAVDEAGEPIAIFNGVTVGAVVTNKGHRGSYSYTAAVPIRTSKETKLPSDNAV